MTQSPVSRSQRSLVDRLSEAIELCVEYGFTEPMIEGKEERGVFSGEMLLKEARHALAVLQSENAPLSELERLREIEHAAWHALEASEDTGDSFIVPNVEGAALADLLPMEHPSHDGLPKGHKNAR